MKNLFTIVIVMLVTSFAGAQCTPPATFAVGPYYLPCGPGNVVISAGTNSAATTYSYSWNGPPFGAMSCPSGTSCSNNSVNAPGVYTVTIFDTTVPGCFSTNTLSVFQSTTLGVNLSGMDTICSGSSAYIWATTYPSSPPASFTWSTGSNLSSITVSPTTTSIYSVTAYNSAYGCSGTGSFTVTVKACVGIIENKTNLHVSVAPNPNNGKFSVTINTKSENAEIRIVNAIGQEVFKQTIKQGNNEINTGTLAKGIYHYTIDQNKRLVSRGKIIIE